MINARITSTYVENTPVPDEFQTMVEDHLHIRGEYFATPAFNCEYTGSPPHTWRIQPPLTQDEIRKRITSTYVENTVWQFGIDGYYWDHLHIRGEYLLNILSTNG